jgi:peptide/nickel transport system substrate-binding protein
MGGTLTIGINADEIVHTHPFMTSLVDDNNLADPIYSHLWRYNDDYEIIGDAAEDWEYIDDTTLRVKIRENITFHKGYGQATSEDVRYSLDLLGETEQSPNTSQRKEWIETIETPDDYTVLIKHPHVFAPYIPLTTSRPMLGRLVSREAYEELGFDGFQDMPIGSGPFVLTERNRGDSFTLEKHDDWHKTDDNGNQLPYLDKIEGKLIPEPATLFNALRTGEVDWVNKLTFELFQSADQEDQLNAYPVEIGGFLAVTMMCSNPAEVADKAVLAGYFEEAEEYNDFEPVTLDVEVRKAISKAIDRKDVSERGTFGIGRPNHLLWPASISHIWEDDETGSQLRDEPSHVYAPDEAERILEEAGYTGDPRLELTFLVNKPNERVGQVIAEHLRNVGIKTNLRVLESASFWPEFYSYKHPLGLTSAGGGSPSTAGSASNRRRRRRSRARAACRSAARSTATTTSSSCRPERGSRNSAPATRPWAPSGRAGRRSPSGSPRCSVPADAARTPRPTTPSHLF